MVREERKKKKEKYQSGLPQLLRWLHALRSDQNENGLKTGQKKPDTICKLAVQWNCHKPCGGGELAQIVTKHYAAPAKNKNNFFDQSKYVVERSSSPSLAKNKHHSSQAKNTPKSFKNKTQPRSRPSICISDNTKQILVQWLYFVQGCLGMLPATQCQARPVVHHPRPDLPVLCNICKGMLYPTQAVQLPKDNHCEELVEILLGLVRQLQSLMSTFF